MAWLVLVVAGVLEIGWAIGLKYTDGFTRLVPTVATVAAMAVSMLLLGLAVRAAACWNCICRLDRHWHCRNSAARHVPVR